MGNKLSEAIIEKMQKCQCDQDMRELWDLIGKYHAGNNATAHNIIQGIPNTGDKVLFHQLINTKFDYTGVRSEEISFPPRDSRHLKKVVISGIAVIDLKNDKCGGKARIVAGGIGADCVHIKLESEVFRGLSFCVIIIGSYIGNCC